MVKTSRDGEWYLDTASMIREYPNSNWNDNIREGHNYFGPSFMMLIVHNFRKFTKLTKLNGLNFKTWKRSLGNKKKLKQNSLLVNRWVVVIVKRN